MRSFQEDTFRADFESKKYLHFFLITNFVAGAPAAAVCDRGVWKLSLWLWVHGLLQLKFQGLTALEHAGVLWSLIFSGCCYRKCEWRLRETKHRIKVNAFDFPQIICNPCGPVIIYTWLGRSNKSGTVM